MEDAVNNILSNFGSFSSEEYYYDKAETISNTHTSKIFQENKFLRCLKCYNIITLGIDTDRNLVILNLDVKRHICSNLNVINDSDKPTISRISDELFLHLIRTQHLDQNAGELKRSYLEQARNLIYKIPVYNPPPVFQVHLSDILDDKIRNELADLDDSDLDDVMRNSIGLVFESINEHYYNLSVRNLLQWEIVA